ncbi:unnamed protein product [Allacma fusca]|uniref:Uncharacterized protein n=1 Tax=Allacma fusca TaxID=39272 RepID=A0A8J2NZR5_9HEXA|nr:unnamed protein product [Allacma fusca]
MLRIILLFLYYNTVAGSLLEEELFSFDTIWSLTCGVSSFVSRSKRSIELPDIYNAKETFDYLFPLANVTSEDFSDDAGRSNSAPGLSMWLDDVVDLWHDECGRMRASKVKTRRVKKSKRKSNRQGRANVNNESKRKY